MNRRRATTFRLYFLGGLILLALSFVVAKLWHLQIVKGSEYRTRLNTRSQVTVRIPAVRGEICDRNGIPLVQNRPSFNVDFYLPTITRTYKQMYGKAPKTTYRAAIHNMVKDLPEDDIVAIVKESIIPPLETLGLAQDFNARKLQLHYRHNIEVPFNYRQDIDFDTIARFSEHNVSLPGVTVCMTPIRNYVYGALAAHILGYVGIPRHTNREEAAKYTFYQPDIEGKSQIELYANDWLKGTPGTRTLQRNVKGRVEGEVSTTPPKIGNNVYLTIDARIQYIVEKALRSVGRAAAVVVNPDNGDILAMASVPSFDPNKFIPTISGKDWDVLLKDSTDPLTNRAISSYAPGSIFKVVTGLAGLRQGIGRKSFTCDGGVQYGNKYMQCWVSQRRVQSRHGSLTLPSAIKVSCNAFFYQYGNAAGIEQIDTIGNMLGLGQKSGVPLSAESSGLLPSPQWLATTSPTERWSAGYTANTAIGQGFVLTTPLQMAMVTAAIANGGISYYPRLIDRVVSPDGRIISQEPPKVRANLLEDGKISPEDLQLIRSGMLAVVNSGGGTGGNARMSTSVAGKTGTAQFWRKGVKDNRVWFIAFSPYDKPKYAVCVMVEGAKSGGGVAAPIVRKILEDIFNMNRGQIPQLSVLAPASGGFGQIGSVRFYGNNLTVKPMTAEDEETADTAPPPDERAVDPSKRETSAPPDLTEEADTSRRGQNRVKRGDFRKFFDIIRLPSKKLP